MSSPEKLHLPFPDEPSPKESKEEKSRRLREEIDSLWDKAATAEDVRAIQAKLESLENLSAPETELEQELRIRQQYESQRNILKQTNILEPLPNGREGIQGIDGKAYAFPSYDEVRERIREKEDIVRTKAEQGFKKLLITPFGMSLNDVLDRYKHTIMEHYTEGRLLATKADPSDPDEQLELDQDQPLYIWDQYRNADTEHNLVYHPKTFTQSHQGQSKERLIQERGAWNILLVEDLHNIPQEHQGATVSGRPQLEAGQTPIEYLAALQTNEIYAHEQGLTPEDHAALSITYLEETDQVIDDFMGNGSICYNIGGYFPAVGSVPGAYWNRADRRASVYRGDPDFRGGDFGVRSAVGV